MEKDGWHKMCKELSWKHGDQLLVCMTARTEQELIYFMAREKSILNTRNNFLITF